MKATELIGKIAIRTSRTIVCSDGSGTHDPWLIIYADDSHIRYQHVAKSDIRTFGDKIFTLPKDFCDNNWREYNSLIESSDENLIKIQKQLEIGRIFIR